MHGVVISRSQAVARLVFVNPRGAGLEPQVAGGECGGGVGRAGAAPRGLLSEGPVGRWSQPGGGRCPGPLPCSAAGAGGCAGSDVLLCSFPSVLHLNSSMH